MCPRPLGCRRIESSYSSGSRLTQTRSPHQTSPMFKGRPSIHRLAGLQGGIRTGVGHRPTAPRLLTSNRLSYPAFVLTMPRDQAHFQMGCRRRAQELCRTSFLPMLLLPVTQAPRGVLPSLIREKT